MKRSNVQVDNRGDASSVSSGVRKRAKFETEEFQKLNQSDPKEAHRIQKRRRRTVAKGKNTVGYAEYIKQVPKHKRRPGSMKHPTTPDHKSDIPNKRWRGLVSAWRTSLHQYDPPDLMDNGTSKKRLAVSEVVPSSRSTKQQRKAGPDSSESENDRAPTMKSVSKEADATVTSALSFKSTSKQQSKITRGPSKKTVTVLGATGGTGIYLVKQALEAGHNVRALVRNPNKFPLGLSLNKNLTVTVGNVTEYEDVKAVIDGSTDVIVSLGGYGKDGKICSTAQPVIDKALNDTDPNIRMVIVTSMAVGDSYHDVTWMTRRFADLVLASTIKDKNLQERSVIKDTTNWVIVRPVGLSDGPLTGTAQGGAHAAPAASKTIARADLAHFILSQCLSGQDEWKRNPVTVFPPQ